MATRGPQNIFSGEILPVAPKIEDPELDAFVRKLLDYLRRLTGKLARFSGGGGGTSTLKTLATTALSQADAVPFDVVWEASLWQDDIFSFTGPSTSITVLESGYYVVEVDWRIYKNFTDHRITVYVNGVSTELHYASYIPNADVDKHYSYMIPLILAANDVLTLRVQSSSDVGVVDGTRLLITKVGAPA